MNARPALIPALLFALWRLLPAESDSLLLDLRLDDVNAIGYNHEFPQYNRSLFGLTQHRFDVASRLLDRIDGLSDTTRIWSMVVSGLAGSEAGDPLLNKYQDPSLANRDHVTNGLVAVQMGSFGIGGIREYNDLYSGRFDRIRNESMPGARKTAYGLSEEDAAAAWIRTSTAGWTGSFSRYRRWHLTPLFFTPLYAEGIRSVHKTSIDADRSHLSVTGSIDLKERYETSDAPLQRTYTSIEAAGSHGISDSLDVTGFVEHRSETTPRTMARGGGDWRTRFGVLSSWCGMYENGRSFAGISACAPVARVARIEARIEERYDPAEESFSFVRVDDTVRYRPGDASYIAGHIAGVVERAAKQYITMARVWCDFQSITLIEAWDSTGANRITATRMTLDDNASTGGASWCGVLHRGVWKVSGNVAGHLLIGSAVQPLYVPWNWRLGVHYGNLQSDSVAASIDLEGNGPVRLTQIANKAMERFSVSPRAAVSFSFRMPFKLPWSGECTKSAFMLDAGPFCIAPDAAASQHPFGNPIGPGVSVRFDLLLLGR
jgi:hypothetical protein